MVPSPIPVTTQVTPPDSARSGTARPASITASRTCSGGMSTPNASDTPTDALSFARAAIVRFPLASVLLATTTFWPPAVTRVTVCQSISTTFAAFPSTMIQSPMPNLCADSSHMPESKLPRNSCSAKASAMEPTPMAANRLPRLTFQMLETITEPQITDRPMRTMSNSSFGARVWSATRLIRMAWATRSSR